MSYLDFASRTALVTFSCLSMLAAQPAHAQQKLVFSIMAPTIQQLPAVILKVRNQEFLSPEGFATQFVTVNSCPDSVRVVASGDANIGEICLDTAMNAIDRGGAGIAIITAQIVTVPYELIAAPEIRTFQDLRGKKVAVAAVKTGSGLIVRKMLGSKGMAEGKDYTLIGAGFTPNRFAALKNRSVDAALLLPPFDVVLAKDGYRSVLDSTEILGDYPFISIAVNKAWAKRNPGQVVGFLRGYSKMLTWLHNGANRDAVIEVLRSDILKNPEHGKFSADLYDKYIAKGSLYPSKLGISEKGIQAALELGQEEGQFGTPLPPVSKFIDPSFAAAAAK